jgi:hypothetical protein
MKLNRAVKFRNLKGSEKNKGTNSILTVPENIKNKNVIKYLAEKQ